MPMQAEITRDSKGRMDTMHITKGDRKLRATIIRDRKGRIERITTTSEISEHDPAR